MKETLYTIPLMDALGADGECPFCFIERKLEQDAIRFILGESYMESDVRAETDQKGFCRSHLKKMYEYGNYLGNAWILSTHLKRLNQDLKEVISRYTPEKKSFMGKFKKMQSQSDVKKSEAAAWIRSEEEHCYFCDRMNTAYDHYLDTFFYLIKKDKEFLEAVKKSKGFCFHHFGDLMEAFEQKLGQREKEELAPVFNSLMYENMKRVEEDICWFIEKYDYRNKDADWKNSKDAIPRTMQKITGGYPGDPPYTK